MHFLYLVSIDKETAKGDPRKKTMNILDRENFCGGEGYWSRGKGDGFVIGGGDSGLLSGKKKFKGKERDCYQWGGYPDDAMIATKEMFERIKKEEGEETEIAFIRDGAVESESTLGKITFGEIKNTYLVVVDAHI